MLNACSHPNLYDVEIFIQQDRCTEHAANLRLSRITDSKRKIGKAQIAKADQMPAGRFLDRFRFD